MVENLPATSSRGYAAAANKKQKAEEQTSRPIGSRSAGARTARPPNLALIFRSRWTPQFLPPCLATLRQKSGREANRFGGIIWDWTASVAALFSRMASTAAPQLQTVLYWSEHFADWHLDDSRRHQLADLSAHGFGLASGSCELCGADSHFRVGTFCRRSGRPAESTEDAGLDAGLGRHAIARPGGVNARQGHQRP